MIGFFVEYYAIGDQREAEHLDIHDAEVAGSESIYSTSVSERVSTATQLKWTYFLLGCATLLPWSVLANQTPFFLSRLAGSPFYSTFPSSANSIYMLTKMVCQFYCTFTSKRSSASRRIFGAMIAVILLVTSLCLSTFVRDTPSTFFAFSLLITASMAVAASYLGTAAYAGAAPLGTPFLQAVFAGYGAIGFAASIVQVASSMIALWGSSWKDVSTDATQAMSRDDQAEEIAARIFFGVSAVFLCATLVVYARLTMRTSDNSTSSAVEQHRSASGSPGEETGLLTNERQIPLVESNSHVYRVFRKNLIFMMSLVYIYAVTLAISPAISARVRPVNPDIHPLLFTAVHFLVYHTGDLLGRYPNLLPWLVVWSGKKILVMSLLRTLFIPLILLCNLGRPVTTTTLPVIHSDILFMLIMLTMGYTSGHASTLALLAVSSLEHNPRLEGRREDVEIAATLGGSFIIFGLVVGALSSFGVQAMI